MIDGTNLKACCAESEPCRPDIAPTPNQAGDKIYDIHIHQVDRGYVVQVGCKTFVSTSARELLDLLIRYLHTPEETLKAFYDKTLFPKD